MDRATVKRDATNRLVYVRMTYTGECRWVAQAEADRLLRDGLAVLEYESAAMTGYEVR